MNFKLRVVVVSFLAVSSVAWANFEGSTSGNPTPFTRDFFIRWKPGTTAAQMNALYQAKGVRPVWRSSLVWGLERVESVTDSLTTRQTFADVARTPGVMYAQPNYKIHRKLQGYVRSMPIPRDAVSETKPNDPMFPQQWALVGDAGVHPEGAWLLTHGSRAVKVAVIDTGVDSKHPELSDRVAPGYDFIDKTANVYDHHGHGTHVSGIIGAATNNGIGIAGINPEITIVPIRAVPTDGDETDQDVISAFEFAVKAGARVANCSFGKAASSQAVGDTIKAAGDHGLLAIVAAGNDGNDLNRVPTYPASFHTPNMIVVSAIGSTGRLASFSNYGVGVADIAAPGVNILSTVKDGGYASWNGTSMATPQVVGVAALVLSLNPAMDVQTLKQIILKSATPDPGLSKAVTTSGRVNATNATKAASQVLHLSLEPSENLEPNNKL